MSTFKGNQAITRREFIQCSVGAMVSISIFYTVCYGDAAENDKNGNLTTVKDNGHKRELKPIAYCGIYCGACPAYVNVIENKGYVNCYGCASDLAASITERCNIRRCARGRNIKTCVFCPEYNTCETLKAFLNLNAFYTKEAGKNLNEIQSKGLEKWQGEQRAQWTCKHCGSPFSWDDRECRKCHTPVLIWIK